jgi:AcrR family transcriptional regulator
VSFSKQKTPSRREEKIQLIIEKAALVFKKRGFVDVAMQDIVNACGISRGGLYKYFGTTAEVFENILRHNSADHDMLTKSIESGESFVSILNKFLELQKHELTNLDDSLRVPTYEYFLKYRASDKTQRIRENLAINIAVVEKLLKYGIDTGEIRKIEHTDRAAMHLVISLEGMNLASIVASLDEETITTQLETLKKLILEGDF